MVVKIPGSCGELAQGIFRNKYCMITCPIDMYTEVSVCPRTTREERECSKALKAMSLTWKYLEKHCEASLDIQSSLLVGKGMASSSADIGAACKLAAGLVGASLSPDEIADIALLIEPTDAVFYPGIMLFDHQKGEIRRNLGSPPPLEIMIFDEDSEVDTLLFNQREDLEELNSIKSPQTKQAFELIIEGMNKKDADLIGRGATISSLANQIILPKRYLETIINIAEHYGALGVNIAHSGTLIGVLFNHTIKNKQICCQEILKLCPNIRFVAMAKVIAGIAEENK